MSFTLKPHGTPNQITVDGHDYDIRWDGSRFRADVSPRARRSYNREWVDGQNLTDLAVAVGRWQEAKGAEKAERAAARAAKEAVVTFPALWYRANPDRFEKVTVRQPHATRDVYLITTDDDRNTEAEPGHLYPADYDPAPALHELARCRELDARMTALSHQASEVVPDSYRQPDIAIVDVYYRQATDDWTATHHGKTFTAGHPRHIGYKIEHDLAAAAFPWALEFDGKWSRVNARIYRTDSIEANASGTKQWDYLFLTEADARAYAEAAAEKDRRLEEHARLTAGKFDYPAELAKAQAAAKVSA